MEQQSKILIQFCGALHCSTAVLFLKAVSNVSNWNWNSVKTQPFINYCWRFGFDWSRRRNVCLIAVCRSVSGGTNCRRCERVGKTPRLCSSTCLALSWYVSPPWSICPLCYFLCQWRRYISGRSKTSRWKETRGLTNSPTSTTTCSPRNWSANGD